MTTNTINTTAALDIVETTRTHNYNRVALDQTIIEANALLCTIRRMIHREQFDAAYWVADDLRHNAAVDTTSSTIPTSLYVASLFDLINVLDGLRNAI